MAKYKKRKDGRYATTINLGNKTNFKTGRGILNGIFRIICATNTYLV